MIALLRPYLLRGGVIALVLLAAYQAGVNAERKRGEGAQAIVERDTARRDQAIAESAAADAARRSAELDALAQSQEKELDALRSQLAAEPQADRPGAPAAALDRLYPGR